MLAFDTAIDIILMIYFEWYIHSITICDPVCKEGYSLFSRTYLVTCNLICEYDITLKIGPLKPLTYSIMV